MFILLLSPPFSFLLSSSSVFFFKKVLAQSGFTQKWLVAAMSICLACAGAAFALQPPVLCELCRLCCWLPAPQAAFCSFVSWHSTLHCRPRSLFSMLIHCFPLLSVPFAVWGKKNTGWPAWAYCPARHPVSDSPLSNLTVLLPGH